MCVITFLFLSARKRERLNQQRYKEHLDNIMRRVDARPLLLEQASQKSVHLAKANYVAALKKVGFSADEIDTLLHEDS